MVGKLGSARRSCAVGRQHHVCLPESTWFSLPLEHRCAHLGKWNSRLTAVGKWGVKVKSVTAGYVKSSFDFSESYMKLPRDGLSSSALKSARCFGIEVVVSYENNDLWNDFLSRRLFRLASVDIPIKICLTRLQDNFAEKNRRWRS